VLAVPGSAARRTALRSFSALPPGGGDIISAAVYAATLWADRASLRTATAGAARLSW